MSLQNNINDSPTRRRPSMEQDGMEDDENSCALGDAVLNEDTQSYQQSISLEYSSSLDESLRDDCSSVTPTTMDVADASFILRQKQQIILQQQQKQQLYMSHKNTHQQQQELAAEDGGQRHIQLCDLDASLRDGDSLMDDQLESTVNTVSTTIEMEGDSINTNTEYMLPTNLAHPSTAVIASTVGAAIALTNNNNNMSRGHKRTQSSVSCRSTASQRAAAVAAALQMLPGHSDSRFSWVFKLFKVFFKY